MWQAWIVNPSPLLRTLLLLHEAELRLRNYQLPTTPPKMWR